VRRAAAALLLAACAGQGERAGGGCPAGELCSPETPDGLFFLGALLGDQPLGRMDPEAVATGGTQTLRLVTGATSSAPPFARDFDAVSSGAALGVDSFAPPDVTVHGLDAGQAYLRIVDPRNGLLFDRLLVEVRDVSRALVRPRTPSIATHDKDFAERSDLDWVALAGSTFEVLVKLEGPSRQRLVDETMLLGAGDGVFALERESWDVLEVRADAAGVVTLRTGDGVARDVAVAVVDVVEDVVAVPAVGAALPAQTQRPGTVNFCFRATHGGRLVAGAEWHFSAPGFTLTPGLAPSCATITGAAGQTGTLEVTASGRLRQFTLTFGPS
jgi:hypothetical protein